MQCQTAQRWQWIISKYSHGFLRNFRKKISKHFIWFSLYYIYVSGQPALKKVRPWWILVVSWLCKGKNNKNHYNFNKCLLDTYLWEITVFEKRSLNPGSTDMQILLYYNCFYSYIFKHQMYTKYSSTLNRGSMRVNDILYGLFQAYFI